MKVVYDALAKDDLAEILAFLQAQGLDRVKKFVRDYRKAIQKVRDFPNAWPKVSRKIRVKIVSKRFPFGVYYSRFKSEIQIGAVVHLSRGSTIWKSRFD